MQYDHEGKISRFKQIIPNNEGLFICDLRNHKQVKEMYEGKNGLTRMSWAFTVGEEEYNRETRTRTIKKVKQSL